MTRTRAGAVLAALLLVGVAAGCWPQEGFDASRSGFSPLESTLTAANVGSLTRAWGTAAGASTTPIVVGGSAFAGAGDAVEAFDTATGAVRWVTHNNDLASSGFTGAVGPLSAVGGNVLAPVNWGVEGGLFTFDDTTGARTGSPQFHSLVLGSVAERSDAAALVGFSFGSGGPFITTLNYGSHQGLLDVGSSGGPTVALTSPTMVGRHVLVGVGNAVESFSLDACPPLPPPYPPSNFC